MAHLISNDKMSLIVGDINAHHSRWDMNTNEDKRGEKLADEIVAADYIILDENEAVVAVIIFEILFYLEFFQRTNINLAWW